MTRSADARQRRGLLLGMLLLLALLLAVGLAIFGAGDEPPGFEPRHPDQKIELTVEVPAKRE